MMRFGPAGNSRQFYEEGYKLSVQAPAWIAAQGLNAYEYSAGHGVALGEATAREIGEQARLHDVKVSMHAPYYINCGTDDAQKRQKTIGYILEAAQALDWMGGDRLVFHPGSPGKTSRESAMARAYEVAREARERLVDAGLEHIHLCPETMGRPSQLGSLEEVLELCAREESFIPALDFGHLHTVGRGALASEDDFERVLIALRQALGPERAARFHAHFSKIEYSAKGEVRHRTFAEEGFGPDFAQLAPLLVREQLESVIICESAGTQAADACAMQRLARDLMKNL